MKVLITGVAGLLGSRLADWLVENYPQIEVVGIDDSKHARNDDVNEDSDLDPEDNWPPWGPEVFQEWGQFLRLGIPGAASLFIEWYY